MSFPWSDTWSPPIQGWQFSRTRKPFLPRRVLRPALRRSVRHPCLTLRLASCRPDLAPHASQIPQDFGALVRSGAFFPPGRHGRLYGVASGILA
jgi:hypothetical protein